MFVRPSHKKDYELRNMDNVIWLPIHTWVLLEPQKASVDKPHWSVSNEWVYEKRKKTDHIISDLMVATVHIWVWEKGLEHEFKIMTWSQFFVPRHFGTTTGLMCARYLSFESKFKIISKCSFIDNLFDLNPWLPDTYPHKCKVHMALVQVYQTTSQPASS